MKRFGAVVVGLALLPFGGSAQLADRVTEVGDGFVRFHFSTRPGVEVCDHGVRIGTSYQSWRGWKEGERNRGCRSDVAEVDVRLRDGAVRSVELTESEVRGRREVVDLGRVDAEEAAEYLLGLAHTDASRDAAEDALLPAMLADAPESWRLVLDLARDEQLHGGIRKNALFWLGQAASDVATSELTEVATDSSEEQDIRDAAVFALSQRPDEESIPILMELAETADEAQTRKQAMFWLAQSDDPRVVDFFAEILLRGAR